MNRTPTERQLQLAANLQAVRDQIASAAVAAGREPADVTLVAVSKYVDAAITADLVAAGCADLGENRPQPFWRKADELAALPIRWHFIGHLQRNKLRRTIPHVSLFHAGDSVRLLTAINEFHASEAESASEADSGGSTDVLLEVNISGDTAKHGFAPEACPEALSTVLELPHIRVRGLMGMAGLGTAPDEARREFARLRDLRDTLQAAFEQVDLSELSMGMSNDFAAAIAEGATLVRVGSKLFEGIT